MAKKTTKDKTQEVVANCNQFEKVVANCDRFEEHIINCDKSVDISGIENMIFSIRGVQVMIDRDLAMLYGVTTSRLNEQVKRNRARFPESSVLHSPIAIEVSIRIMNAFVAMRRFMIQNAAVLKRIAHFKKHNTQYPEIAFIQLPHRNHDRFLIIDDKVYLLSASLKDIGAGLCAVTEMTIAPEVILGMVR